MNFPQRYAPHAGDRLNGANAGSATGKKCATALNVVAMHVQDSENTHNNTTVLLKYKREEAFLLFYA